MWQGWINFLDGLWLLTASFIWQWQTSDTMIIAGAIALLFGAWSYKTWQGLMLAFCGFFVLASGISHYMVLPINIFLFGGTIALLGIWEALTHNRALSSEKVH